MLSKRGRLLLKTLIPETLVILNLTIAYTSARQTDGKKRLPIGLAYNNWEDDSISLEIVCQLSESQLTKTASNADGKRRQTSM